MDPLTSLPAPKTFEPTGLRIQLLDQISDLAERVNAARDEGKGLPPETVAAIEKQLLIDRVYESNAIEGNPLDRRETVRVIATGEIVQGKRRAAEEVLNLVGAIEQAQNLTEPNGLREVDIRQLHGTLLRGLHQEAGRYRLQSVKISGAEYQPPESGAVPALMEELVSKLSHAEREQSPICAAAFAHWAIARIHPFVDGNGRMARLMQDVVLLRHRLVPVVVPAGESADYYSALQDADESQPQAFIELVANGLLKSLLRYNAAIDVTLGRQKWLSRLISAANERQKNNRYAKFQRWRSHFGEIKQYFEMVASQLDEQVGGLSVRFRDYGGIGFDQYDEIVSKGSASRTWDFGLDFRFGELRVRFVFWYGSHHQKPWDVIQFDREPVLLISAEQSEQRFELLDDLGEASISLREIGMSGGKLTRVRYDPIADRYDNDVAVTPDDIAQHFFQEVLENRLGAA